MPNVVVAHSVNPDVHARMRLPAGAEIVKVTRPDGEEWVGYRLGRVVRCEYAITPPAPERTDCRESRSFAKAVARRATRRRLRRAMQTRGSLTRTERAELDMLRLEEA